MNQDSCFQLGYLAKIHGLEGEIKAIFEADNPDKYGNLESVYVQQGTKLIPFFIEHIRKSNQYFLLKFEDVDGPEEASTLAGSKLFLPLDLLPKLPDDEFYFHEILGWKVIDTRMGAIGIIRNYYQTGVQDILELDLNGTEVLVPMNRDFLKNIDRKSREITFELPDGLVDLYLDNAD